MSQMQDTGERITYEGGAQREPHQGKGRYDWISPFALERVVAVSVRIKRLQPELNVPLSRQAISASLSLINRWREGYRDQDRLAAAAWWVLYTMHFEETVGEEMDIGKDVHDFGSISPHALQRLADWCEKGGIKYGDRNWEKGMPYEHPLDSAMRHVNKWLMRMTDEDHLAAAVWNLFALMHYEACHMDRFDNIPRYPEAKALMDSIKKDLGIVSPSEKNRVLTIEQIKKLDDGTPVWVETIFVEDDDAEGRHIKNGDCLENHDGFWEIDEDLQQHARVWALPVAPTKEEREANPWNKTD